MAPAKKAAAAPAKKKSISFAAETKPEKVVAPAKVVKGKIPEGVIAPRSQQQKGGSRAPVPAKQPAKRSVASVKSSSSSKKKQEEEESESESDSDEEDDEDSDLEDLMDDSSDDEDELTEDTKGRKGGKLSYPVLLLRYLPAEFQEPQLQKFLNQFGAKVVNCFCVRSKRTNVSKGTAYVQFDDAKVLPLVIEECNGMMLGGRTVRARKRLLHRPMPRRDEIRIRRLRGYRNVTQGRKLTRHNASQKNLVAALIKYSRSERANNAALKALGVDFSSTSFQDQLKRVPQELFVVKKKEGAKETAAAAAPAAVAATPTKIAADASSPAQGRKSAEKPVVAEIVQPKEATPVKQTPTKAAVAAVTPVSAAKTTPAAKATPSKKTPKK